MEPSLNTGSAVSLSSTSFNFCYIAPSLDASVALGRVPLHTVLKDAFQGLHVNNYKSKGDANSGADVDTIAIAVQTSNLVTTNYYVSGALKTVEITAPRTLDKYILQKGDVVISARYATFTSACHSENDPNFVNTMETLSITNPNLPVIPIVTSNIILLRPNQAVLSSEYLTLWFRSEEGRAAINSISKRVTGKSQFAKDSWSSLRPKDVSELILPVPSLAEQAEIVSRYKAEVIDYKLQYEAERVRAETHFQVELALREKGFSKLFG